MKNFTLIFLICTSFHYQAQTVTDIDGNIYNTVTIGTQIWMKENLKTKHFQNGDSIGTTYPTTKDITAETSPKYQWAYNGNESNVADYGRMYTWFAVTDPRNLCPAGWHAPTEAEWRDLGIYLVDSIAGGKLKETGTTHWLSPNPASNSTNFTALPGGIRFWYGVYTNITTFGSFWTASEYNPTNGLYRIMKNTDVILGRANGNKKNGYSVRCVNNNPASSIKNSDLMDKVNVFPNPAHDEIHIDTDKINLKLVIYNLLGEQVLQKELSTGANSIDIRTLPVGTYLIKLSYAEGIFQQKLVKE